jgi:hypothetical protein
VPEQLARLLVRAFGTINQQGIPLAARESLLAEDTVRDWGRRVVRASQYCNQFIPAGQNRRLRYRDEIVDREFARVWRCAPDEVEAAAWDRGMFSIRQFRRLAEPFVSYLKAGIRLDPPRVSEG